MMSCVGSSIFLAVLLISFIDAISITPAFPEDSEPPVHDCSSPPVTGPCKAAMMEFNYNAATGKCEEFTYGGCEGNDNRYDTEEECVKYCGSKGGASSTSQSASVKFVPANATKA